MWWHLQQLVEHTLYEDGELQGMITDIVKCYNNIPRPVIYACGLRLGIPKQLLLAWFAAIGGIDRRFVVDKAISPPLGSVTGFPEGDALSVAAMMMLNEIMHQVLSQQVPAAITSSYVDNWEVRARDLSTLLTAAQSMRDFSEMVDLTLDQKKTTHWALTANTRKELRKLGCQVVLAEKDLGGQMAFCKKHTNYVRHRILANADLWTWLRRSPATIPQKLKILKTVAWPRCLYGISNATISQDHFNRLRAAAMQSLGWAKKGASSTLQFGLAVPPDADPAFCAIRSSIVAFRRLCHPEREFPIVNMEPAKRFHNGPSGVLLDSLHQIGWQWDHDGWLLDHDGLPLELLHVPIQYLEQRLRQGWEAKVGGQLQSRNGFAGLGDVDAELSRLSYEELTPEQSGLLRAAHHGTFYTWDALVHTGKVPNPDCPFCGQPDAIGHRLWQCHYFDQDRDPVSTELLTALNVPPSMGG